MAPRNQQNKPNYVFKKKEPPWSQKKKAQLCTKKGGPRGPHGAKKHEPNYIIKKGGPMNQKKQAQLCTKKGGPVNQKKLIIYQKKGPQHINGNIFKHAFRKGPLTYHPTKGPPIKKGGPAYKPKNVENAFKKGGPHTLTFRAHTPYREKALFKILLFVKFGQDDNLCCRTLNPKLLLLLLP